MKENTCYKIPREYTLIIVLGIATLALLMPVNIVGAAPDSTKYDLTGVWKCDDGGTYYLRQIGDTLWWYGESAPVMPDNGARWSNIVVGSIYGNTIDLQWRGVPKGDALPNGKQSVGILFLNIVSNDELRATKKTSGFGGSHWTRSGTASSNSSTSDSSGTVTGQSQASILVETDHPCANSYHHTWTISTPPDTTQMRIHFAKLDIGNDDELSLEHNSGYLKDFSINDNKQDFWTDWYGVNSMDVVLGTSSTKDL